MARAPVSKTGGWGFESLHSCQVGGRDLSFWLKHLIAQVDFADLTLRRAGSR
jgi:hypothetical protein